MFTHVPTGEYAIIAFHDEDSSGVLEHNFLGLPNEPLGFSGGYDFSVFSGMPTFEKLSFVLSSKTNEYRIRIEAQNESEDDY